MTPFLRRADAAVTALILLALPIVLVVATGNPFASSTPTLAMGALLSVWAVWAWCVGSLLKGVVRHVRQSEPAREVRGPLDRLSLTMASALLAALAWLPASPAHGSPPRDPTSTIQARANRASTMTKASPTTKTGPTTTSAATAIPAPTTYVVVAGDCLWDISARLYGDGDLWPLLANANLGRVMADGQVFVNPSLIYPGWVLAVPPVGTTPSTPVSSPLIAPSAPRDHSMTTESTTTPTTAVHRHAPVHSQEAWRPLGEAVVLGTGIGGGLIVFGLLARRRRRLSRLGRDVPLDDASVEIAIAAQRLERSPLVSMLERAIWLAEADGVLDAPSLLEVRADCARLYKAGEVAWRAPAADLVDHAVVLDHAPALVLPLGDDGEGSWALVAPPGSRVEFGGRDAESFVELVLDAHEDVAWGSMVFEVTSNEQLADLAATTDEGVLCYTRRQLVDAADVVHISMVESAAVRIEDGMVELRDLDRRIPASHVVDHAERIEPNAPNRGPHLVPPATEGNDVSTQRIVHLLASQPWIEGLAVPLDANRTRRATELLAYLALHYPEQVTSDRLRSRVLGTSSTDAASKTLFNVASALRRALGVHDGEPVFPRATHTGLYRAGPLITTDIATFESLVAEATAHDDPETSLALLREAFLCIEGAPLDAVLMGYEWFDAEGHRGHLETIVEDAARRAINLSVDLGHVALATFIIERARLVVPYSELLAELSLEVAGAAADPDALRRAFREIAELMDELDPGRGPRPAVEQRYRELSSRVEARQASLAAMDAAPRNTSPSAPAAL